jgi:hypothetical protein
MSKCVFDPAIGPLVGGVAGVFFSSCVVGAAADCDESSVS